MFWNLAFSFFFFFSPEVLEASEKSAALLCKKYIQRVEKEKKIPLGLLAAISIIESGKKTKSKKNLVAWPWALNIDGSPEYHRSKTKAHKSLLKHLRSGVTNIDVGCMQINYRHHGKAFKSLLYMLDPWRNVVYGADFLISLKKRHGSWTKAVGHYHSSTLKHQVPYRRKVYRKWQSVRNQKKETQSFKKKKFMAIHQSLTIVPRSPEVLSKPHLSRKNMLLSGFDALLSSKKRDLKNN